MNRVWSSQHRADHNRSTMPHRRSLSFSISLSLLNRVWSSQHRTDRNRSTAPRDLAPRSHPSTSPANPEPRSCIRLHRDRTETAPIALRSQRNGWVLMNLTGFDEFFFDGFCLCVYLLRNGIIYLFGSWENVRKKKKMCFLYYFQQHNQTLENIFLIFL